MPASCPSAVSTGLPKGANLFNFAYVENRGCAWGLFQGQVWPLAVLYSVRR